MDVLFRRAIHALVWLRGFRGGNMLAGWAALTLCTLYTVNIVLVIHLLRQRVHYRKRPMQLQCGRRFAQAERQLHQRGGS
jgi:hypothetical protein